jgi:hypothetical protein
MNRKLNHPGLMRYCITAFVQRNSEETSQNGQSQGQDLNPGSAEYEARTLPTHLRWLISHCTIQN